MFPIITVEKDKAEAIEFLGTKYKFWYRHKDELYLFKAEERGTGEDWAEKVCCELAELLGLPHVRYDMAKLGEDGLPGTVCRTFAPEPLNLVHGNEMLFKADSSYPLEPEKNYQVREHTLDAVFNVMESLEMPPRQWCKRLPEQVLSAAGVYAGYLMLDAWVANQDRHHQNWGAIRHGEKLMLAPSFDHGAALARNLSDAERSERLQTRDKNRQIPHFVRRARSALYFRTSATRPMSTLKAWEEWARRVPSARQAWVRRISGISAEEMKNILGRVEKSRMSDVCQEFTLKLLVQNRKRILELEES
ncbi:MAG TPA: hypothetical protein VK064_00975 [Wenzhouxiangella sp.]|nr:hypothetical protein [Wenzhouxiangella sp.]